MFNVRETGENEMTDQLLKFLQPSKKEARPNNKLTQWFDIPERPGKPRTYFETEEVPKRKRNKKSNHKLNEWFEIPEKPQNEEIS